MRWLLIVLFSSAVIASDSKQPEAMPIGAVEWKFGADWRYDAALMLTALDSDNFEERQNAEASLERIGPEILPQIRQTLKISSSVEVQTRCRRLIGNLEIDEKIAAALLKKDGLAELVKF